MEANAVTETSKMLSRPLIWSGIFILILILPSLFGLWVDERLLNGINVWIKPIKFQLSVGVYLITLGWFVQYVNKKTIKFIWGQGFIYLMILSGIFEVMYITYQASQGEPSHFNNTTVFHSVMYSLMAVGAVFLVLGSFLLGCHFIKDKTSPLTGMMRYSIGFGLVLTCILGGIEGFAISGNEGHVVGAPEDDSNGLWLLGWNTEGGDLRVAHFFGLHAMHFIPLMAWLIQGGGSLIEDKNQGYNKRFYILGITILIYISGTVFTFFQALNGQSVV